MKTLLQILLIAAFTGTTGVALATNEPVLTVAIFDFTSNVGMVVPKDITALITANLSAEPRLALVERAKLNKALGEQALGLSGNIDFAAAAKVGQLTGAKVLISGRAIKTRGEMVIIANVIGAETSRLFSEKVQGAATNLLELTSTLSQKIVETIVGQATNFVAQASVGREQKIAEMVAKLKGPRRPSVSVAIREKIPPERGPHQTAQIELAVIFQKAGFNVVDDKSERRPDIIITGTAIAAGGEKTGNVYSSRATVEIKVLERASGKIVLIDRQESIGLDIGKQTAARVALQNAADELAGRLLPMLAEPDEKNP